MGRSNPRQILNMLAQSSNEFAAGIAMVVKALADANASPPASPIMIDYRGMRMAFGRRNLGMLNGWVRSDFRFSFTPLSSPLHLLVSMPPQHSVPHIHRSSNFHHLLKPPITGCDPPRNHRNVPHPQDSRALAHCRRSPPLLRGRRA